jgi:hypothetical protein
VHNINLIVNVLMYTLFYTHIGRWKEEKEYFRRNNNNTGGAGEPSRCRAGPWGKVQLGSRHLPFRLRVSHSTAGFLLRRPYRQRKMLRVNSS